MQHPVAYLVDARRPKAHLSVIVDVEEVGRPQMLVTLRIPGVDAVGIDRQLDLRPIPPDLVRSAEPASAAARIRLVWATFAER